MTAQLDFAECHRVAVDHYNEEAYEARQEGGTC